MRRIQGFNLKRVNIDYPFTREMYSITRTLRVDKNEKFAVFNYMKFRSSRHVYII